MDHSSYQAYKNTEITWLGHIPEHWEVVPIKFSLSVPITDGPHETPKLYREGVPFLSAEAVKADKLDFSKMRGFISLEEHERFSKKYKPEYGDVYMVKSGATTGNVARVETKEEFSIWSPLAAIRPDGESLTTDFIFYFMKSKPFFYSVELSWSYGTQQNIGMGVISNLKMARPPLEEQIRIGSYLNYKTTQIDHLIEKKKALIEKLNEQRISVITQAVTKGLNPDVQVMDSEVEWLGRVPRHWKIMRLRFLSEGIEQGWSPQCDSQPAEENEWGVLKVGCVNGNNLDVTENKALPISLEPKLNYEIQPGEILISRANTKELVGSAAIVPADVRKKLILCDKLYRLEPTDEIDSRYLLFILRSPLSRYQYEREATGASGSMQNIGQDIIRNLLVTLPTFDEQQDIVEFLSGKLKKIDDMVAINQQTIEKLEEYRTALITAAVTGKIDVRNVEIPDQDAA